MVKPAVPRASLVLLLVLVLAVAGPGAAAFAPSAARAAESVSHALSVSGDGVSSYPPFAADLHHYGIRTTSATGGDVTVTATTDDPLGHVTIDGAVPDGNGQVSLTGLTAGQEIRVEYDDASGVTVDSLIYLPSDFPALVAATTGTPQPGDVFVNVGGYATALDENAVPVFLMSDRGGADFKRQPNGNYSTAVPVTANPAAGFVIAELGRHKAFEQVASHSALAPVVNTDSHDSILEQNGNQVTISYEDAGNRVDAVIQEADSAGHVLFSWNSYDHGFRESDAYVTGPPPLVDYMHINSIQITPDGDFLASFRNLSAVVKIARTAHDGYAEGDVIWQLGGKHNDFTFANDPFGGPCAQHTAYELPDGNLLLFDDGAKADPTLGPQTGDFCPDPNAQDPDLTRTARPESRAVEYSLDETTHTATVVWSYDPGDFYTAFAGSTQRLANGDTLIDWAFNGNPLNPIPIATEVNAAGDVVWQLSSPDAAFSYRAFKFPVPMAPSAPRSLSVVAGRNKVTATWRPPISQGVSPITGYRVFTSTSSTGPFDLAGRPTATSFTVSHLAGGTRLYVKVATDNAVGTSRKSPAGNAVAYDTPSAPRSLLTTTGKKKITLAWTAPATSGGAPITAYRVYRRTRGTAWKRVATTSSRSFADTGLKPGTRYYYQVAAVNTAGASPPSSAASGVPFTTPSVPRALLVTPENHALAVNWRAPASSGWTPITGYVVRYRACWIATGSCTLHLRTVESRTVTLRSLSPAKRYHVRVRAVNKGGYGPYTAAVAAVPFRS